MQVQIETYPGETWTLEEEEGTISVEPTWNWERFQTQKPGIEQLITDFQDSRCKLPEQERSVLEESAFCSHLGLKGKLSDLGIKAISNSHP
jgi:hypothetical protein